MKWIMEQTHLHPCIPELETILETDCIEDFIESLADEWVNLDAVLLEKPWLDDEEDEYA